MGSAVWSLCLLVEFLNKPSECCNYWGIIMGCSHSPHYEHKLSSWTFIKHKKQVSSSPSPQNGREKIEINTEDLKGQISSQCLCWLNKQPHFLKPRHKSTFPYWPHLEQLQNINANRKSDFNPEHPPVC